MPEYIYPPGEPDEERLQQEALDYLVSRWPDWDPRESNLEVWLVEACARMVAEAADVAADVPLAIFRYYGETIMGVPPIDETAAQVNSTWTITSNPDGRTIEAGTLVAIPGEGDELKAFEVVVPVTLAATVLSTDPGQVLLRAIDSGTQGTGLGGTGLFIDPIDSESWFETIQLTSLTSGGTDGESDDEYIRRLTARLTLLTPRPILPRDFALLAKDIAAQNGSAARVLAVDGYKVADGTYNNERMIHLIMAQDDTGADLSSGVRDAVDLGLQAMREVNFIVTVGNPTRTPVDVTFVGVARPGFDPAEVNAVAEAMVTDYLLPANWGQRDARVTQNTETDDGTRRLRDWFDQPVVRQQDISTVLNNVDGFDYWTTLTIGLNGGAQTSADHALAGVGALTSAGAINGTVS